MGRYEQVEKTPNQQIEKSKTPPSTKTIIDRRYQNYQHHCQNHHRRPPVPPSTKSKIATTKSRDVAFIAVEETQTPLPKRQSKREKMKTGPNQSSRHLEDGDVGVNKREGRDAGRNGEGRMKRDG
ncbi:Hypothetical predicted protein [Olea europaea subsp. europaea]|uniref:Uncharacterized protein n=1 Tax=Olea europaea subsp. europaea TaxID=158383 RepID=A0A8S0SQ70_OLEEU|nr:Hypothetical predicted protein [Olea europaea subsp. europaea]